MNRVINSAEAFVLWVAHFLASHHSKHFRQQDTLLGTVLEINYPWGTNHGHHSAKNICEIQWDKTIKTVRINLTHTYLGHKLNHLFYIKDPNETLLLEIIICLQEGIHFKELVREVADLVEHFMYETEQTEN